MDAAVVTQAVADEGLDGIQRREHRVKTYDITEKDAQYISDVLEHVGATDVAERFTPLCNADERLVCSAAAFREFFEDTDAEFVASLTDEEIDSHTGGIGCVEQTWATACNEILETLYDEHEGGDE